MARPKPQVNKGPQKWREDGYLTITDCLNMKLRFSIGDNELQRQANIGQAELRRWLAMHILDPRHPFPTAKDVSRGMARCLTRRAIEQIEHNAAFITPEQRRRILKALGAEEPNG